MMGPEYVGYRCQLLSSLDGPSVPLRRIWWHWQPTRQHCRTMAIPSSDACVVGSTMGSGQPAEKTGVELIEAYDFVKNCPDIVDAERQRLRSLLLEYSDLFVDNLSGRTSKLFTAAEHAIPLVDNTPVNCKMQKHSFAERRIIREQIGLMLGEHVIRPSFADYCSPVVLVQRKDGRPRFCTNYRRLNAKTIPDRYPLPDIEMLLAQLKDAKWFTSLDLAAGYYQIPIREEDKHKTAFRVEDGLYEYNVLPFGLMNAPSTFQRAMDAVLQGLLGLEALVYIDDILILGTSFDQHLGFLRRVFDRLWKYGLFVKFAKCHFVRRQLTWLGFLIGVCGLMADPDKVKAIRDWPTPTSVEEVRSFLGTAGFLQKFCAHYARIARPLYATFNKDFKFEWRDEQDKAFNELKSRMTSLPALVHPDFDKDFYVITDACKEGLGAVLAQVVDGLLRPVAFFSKATRPDQKKLTTRELECLAVVEALQRWRPFLHMHPRNIIVQTDHQSLRWLLDNENFLSGKMARWAMKIMEYNPIIEYRPGKLNTLADGLSRRPPILVVNSEDSQLRSDYVPYPPWGDGMPNPLDLEHPSDLVTTDLVHSLPVREQSLPMVIVPARARVNGSMAVDVGSIPTFVVSTDGITSEDIRRAQDADALVVQIRRFLTAGVKPSDEKWAAALAETCHEYYISESDVLCRTVSVAYGNQKVPVNVIVAPATLIPTILRIYHDSPETGGHFGDTHTREHIERNFWWPKMASIIHHYCSSCELCQKRKQSKASEAVLPQPVQAPQRPFQRVMVDYVGPLTVTRRGNRFILSVLDVFSHWAIAIPTRSADAITTAIAFHDFWIAHYGAPEVLQSDRGSHFVNDLVDSVNTLFYVHHVKASAWHPNTEGKVERFNSVVEQMLRLWVHELPQDWDVMLPSLMMAYRDQSRQDLGGYSPFYMIHGLHMRLPSDSWIEQCRPNMELPYIEILAKTLPETRTWVAQFFELQQQRQMDVAVHNASDPVRLLRALPYHVGDLVWLHKIPARSDPMEVAKFKPLWEGPFQIVDILRKDLVHLRRFDTQEPMRQLVNTRRLRKCIQRDTRPKEELSEEELAAIKMIDDEFDASKEPKRMWVPRSLLERAGVHPWRVGKPLSTWSKARVRMSLELSCQVTS